MGSVAVFAVGFTLVLATGLSGLVFGVRNSGLRLLGLTALLAVMMQGLLGGFRVKLNELVGTDLAAVHGVFAQVVLSLLVLLAVLTEQPSSPDSATIQMVTQPIAGQVGNRSHGIDFCADRLGGNRPAQSHAAHAAAALFDGVPRSRGCCLDPPSSVLASPAASTRIGMIGWVLVGLLVAQLYLGVEAWMMKFGLYMLPELVQPSRRRMPRSGRCTLSSEAASW